MLKLLLISLFVATATSVAVSRAKGQRLQQTFSANQDAAVFRIDPNDPANTIQVDLASLDPQLQQKIFQAGGAPQDVQFGGAVRQPEPLPVAPQQQFGGAITPPQFNNAVPQQQFGGAFTQPQSNNVVPQQQFGGAITQSQFNNAVPQQQFGGAFTQSQSNNVVPQQQFGGAITQPQFNNAVPSQQFASQVGQSNIAPIPPQVNKPIRGQIPRTNIPAGANDMVKSLLHHPPGGALLVGTNPPIVPLNQRLISNYTKLRPANLIKDTFRCSSSQPGYAGYGYYADVDNDCQLFHVCLPWQQLFPTVFNQEVTYQFSFICPNQTVFSQDSMTCSWKSEAINCQDSPALYWLNRNFFRMQPDNAGGHKYVPVNEVLKEPVIHDYTLGLYNKEQTGP